MTKPSLLIYHEWVDLFKQMPAEDVKTVLLALLEYMDSGEVPEMEFENPLVRAIFQMMLQKTRDNRDAYYEKCAKNRENGKLGGAPKGNKNAAKNNRTVEKTTQNNPIEGKGKEENGIEGKGSECEGKGKEGSSHTPPSREEVKDFCKAEGLKAIDPDRFWNYYTGVKDWRNDRGDLIDWKAQARYWNSQDAEAKKAANTEFNNFSQRNTDWKSLEKELLAK